MQPAFSPALAGPAAAPSAKRLAPLMAAAIAVAGTGVIAAAPVAANISAASLADVQLTGFGDGLGDVLTGYGQTIQTSLSGSWAGIEDIFTGGGGAKGLETILPQIFDYLQAGDVTNAYNLINNDMLFDMLNVFQPLFDHTVRGTGEEVAGLFGIPASMTHELATLEGQLNLPSQLTDFTNGIGSVQELLGDFDLYKGAAKELMEPFIGFMFALSDNLTGAEGNTPQDPFDALLNGYIPWAAQPSADPGADPHAQFIGLLGDKGTFNYLFDTLPQKFSDAFTDAFNGDDADGAASGGASLFSSLNLSELFGGDSSLTDLLGGLDPSAFGDAISDFFTNGFDFGDLFTL